MPQYAHVARRRSRRSATCRRRAARSLRWRSAQRSRACGGCRHAARSCRQCSGHYHRPCGDAHALGLHVHRPYHVHSPTHATHVESCTLACVCDPQTYSQQVRTHKHTHAYRHMQASLVPTQKLRMHAKTNTHTRTHTDTRTRLCMMSSDDVFGGHPSHASACARALWLKRLVVHAECLSAYTKRRRPAAEDARRCRLRCTEPAGGHWSLWAHRRGTWHRQPVAQSGAWNQRGDAAMRLCRSR